MELEISNQLTLKHCTKQLRYQVEIPWAHKEMSYESIKLLRGTEKSFFFSLNYYEKMRKKPIIFMICYLQRQMTYKSKHIWKDYIYSSLKYNQNMNLSTVRLHKCLFKILLPCLLSLVTFKHSYVERFSVTWLLVYVQDMLWCFLPQKLSLFSEQHRTAGLMMPLCSSLH